MSDMESNVLHVENPFCPLVPFLERQLQFGLQHVNFCYVGSMRSGAVLGGY
jgi:hypothetical protein